jgi:hypothetical protein
MSRGSSPGFFISSPRLIEDGTKEAALVADDASRFFRIFERCLAFLVELRLLTVAFISLQTRK